MQRNTPLARESFQLTGSSERTIRKSGGAVETASPKANVIAIQSYAADRPSAPDRYSSIGKIIRKWEGDELRRKSLEKGRRWVARSFYGDDGDTIRGMRLSRGWSQQQLAGKLKTSQPHVARIERGTENLTIDTCRRLAAALEIDLNSLNDALLRQEAIARAKVK